MIGIGAIVKRKKNGDNRRYTVTDKAKMRVSDEKLYEVKDEYGSKAILQETEIEEASLKDCALTQRIELQGIAVTFEEDGKNVYARLYDAETGEQISAGCGHILREGRTGIIQAMSYAAMRAYKGLPEVREMYYDSYDSRGE